MRTALPNGVTFVRHSAHSLAKTHVCRGLVDAEADPRAVEWRKNNKQLQHSSRQYKPHTVTRA